MGEVEKIGELQAGMVSGASEDILVATLKHKGKSVRTVYKPDKGVYPKYKKGTLSAGEREAFVHDIDKFMDLKMVPETVHRNLGNGIGSVQKFIENSKTAQQVATKASPGKSNKAILKAFKDAKTIGTVEERVKLNFLDIITSNKDRHLNNILIDSKGKMHAIDNALSMSRTSVKDIFGIKERYTILLTMLTKTESNAIYDKFDDKAVKNFTVNETNLTINTNVLVSVKRREYNVPGGDLRVDLTLDLIEETAT